MTRGLVLNLFGEAIASRPPRRPRTEREQRRRLGRWLRRRHAIVESVDPNPPPMPTQSGERNGDDRARTASVVHPVAVR